MNAWKNKIFYSKAEKVKGTVVLLILSDICFLESDKYFHPLSHKLY